MKKGIYPLSEDAVRFSRRVLFADALAGKCPYVLHVTADLVSGALAADPRLWTTLKTTFSDGRLALLPFDPALAGGDEELLLTALFASAHTGEAFGIRPTGPCLLGLPETPALFEILSHFGYERVSVFADEPRSDVICRTPDGSPITLSFLPAKTIDGNVVFDLPSETCRAKTAPAEPGAKILPLPLFSEMPREKAVRLAVEEKKRLTSLFSKRLAPLSAALQMAGLSAAPFFDAATRIASVGASASFSTLAAVTEELRTAEEALMTSAWAVLPHAEDVWGEILLFNPLTTAVRRTATLAVTLPQGIRTAAAAQAAFLPTDENGKGLSFEVPSVTPRADGTYEALLHLEAGRIPPLSFARIFLRSEHTGAPKARKKAESLMENRHYRIVIEGDDLLLTVKATGKTLKNPFFLEEQGSAVSGGFRSAAEGSLLFYPDLHTSSFLQDPAGGALSLSFSPEIPLSYDFEKDERSMTEASLALKLRIAFAGDGGELLSLSYAFDDPAAHHRLRLAVRTGRIPAQVFLAEGRRMAELPLGSLPPADLYASRGDGMHFAAYPAEGSGAEWVNDTLYLPLLTADAAPAGACRGRLALFFGKDASPATLLSHARYIAGEPLALFFASDAPRIPSEPRFPGESITPCTPKNTNVVNALSELNLFSGVLWSGKDILPVAVKPGEDRSGAILRFFLMGETEGMLAFHADLPIAVTDLSELAALPLAGTDVRLRVPPLGSLTLRLSRPVSEGEPCPAECSEKDEDSAKDVN